ncbi:hypothetical protein SBOR_1143 [Sclerotinia borealis F-4128]|uniref:Uncharacterized protein n=1 Tax=Sclerotinia borealis (strain F-4128) TaxID=1432307 RepID=W9CRJ8_SCLBF|nr:hypothetical protein SBOR_1143 [Sclerotinia borealis F-4128]
MVCINLPIKEKVDFEREDQVLSPSPPPFAIITPLLKCTKIKKIRCDTDEYHFYGVFSPKLIVSEAAKFVSKNSSASRSSLKKIFKKFIAITSHDSQQDCQVSPEAIWFLVRMTRKSGEFIMPRWHRDGRMTGCTEASHVLHCRYATTLVGPPTLVLQETEVVSQGMRAHAANRKELSNALASEVPLNISQDQIIRFSWGRDDSPVHSEPDLFSERVFASCVYGSAEEVRDIISTRRQYGDYQAFFRTCEEKRT